MSPPGVSSRLPSGTGRAFAGLLHAGTRPFDIVNYLGAVGAVRVLGPCRMAAMSDRVVAHLDFHRRRLTLTETR
ncbi:hypothetical protein J7E93_35405 [Streptomyces sp. ISL-36]|uniref:hypothetical protein n=1 Tax=Streptomyces sp. ISL-36 TaxID=2819182 RepID=UPI001BE5C345|nr:hypothetical protein [Streptomyces sp. ISL-36]MBT2445282.1 hypothetical protein [Streptomyces sp. ISL-36]